MQIKEKKIIVEVFWHVMTFYFFFQVMYYEGYTELKHET